MRKLVTVREVKKLFPIKGADKIECALIDGWEVIVKKGEYSEGCLCLFFEIDSFVPVSNTQFSFLGSPKEHRGVSGWRIRTIKMRGQISQGLAIPLPKEDMEVDTDYSELYNVFKYEREVSVSTQGTGKTKGSFPDFIPKTDQERVQNRARLWDTHLDTTFEITTKLDGSSCTMYKEKLPMTRWDKICKFIGINVLPRGQFGVCSRNLELNRDENKRKVYDNDGKPSEFSTNNFWYAAEKYGIEEKLPIGFAVQGELIGPKIQGNYEKVHDIEYYIFDVYDIEKSKYLTPRERMLFCSALGFPHVPIIGYKKILSTTDLKGILDMAVGPGMNAGVRREGLVFKAVDGMTSFKAISNEYLLKYED